MSTLFTSAADPAVPVPSVYHDLLSALKVMGTPSRDLFAKNNEIKDNFPTTWKLPKLERGAGLYDEWLEILQDLVCNCEHTFSHDFVVVR